MTSDDHKKLAEIAALKPQWFGPSDPALNPQAATILLARIMLDLDTRLAEIEARST
jgi:hypothetical protein